MPSNGSIDANAVPLSFSLQYGSRGDATVFRFGIGIGFGSLNGKREGDWRLRSMCAQCHQNLNSKQARRRVQEERERGGGRTEHSLMSATFFSGAKSSSAGLWIVWNVAAAAFFFIHMQLGNINRYAKG